MPRSSKFVSTRSSAAGHGPRFWLQSAAIVLVVLNAVAAFLYIAPPGGSRRALRRQSEQLGIQLAGTRAQAVRLQTVASKVQLGSAQSSQFARRYFLTERQAYEAVMSEIQRVANIAGVQERDAAYTQEPIEGSPDLSVLNVTARYEGRYENLMRFLYQVDKSPMLLVLDTLQAAPQQRSGQIDTEIRFQAIVREDSSGEATPAAGAGGQP